MGFLMFIQLLVTSVFILISVAFFSLFERKLMGLIQLRKGPNKVSILGILQPISDALKLASKVDTSPNDSMKLMYLISPVLFILISFIIWLSLPVMWCIVYMQSGILFLVFCFSFSIYGLVSLGWFSNSKYASIGSVRSISQTISYEIVLSFCIFGFMLSCMSVNMFVVVNFQESIWFISPFFVSFLVMYISLLAEGNRSPFDLSEGESELVSGFCIEYGGMSYTLVFLAENMTLMFMSFMLVILFFGQTFLLLKICILVTLFVWVRATMPRMRFDKVMHLCWVKLMPISLLMVAFYSTLS